MQPMIRVTGQKKSISASESPDFFQINAIIMFRVTGVTGGGDEMCFNEYLFGIFESS